VGIGTQLDQWNVGLTVTTPGVKLFGSGRIAGDRTRIAVPERDDELIFVNEEGISSTYKSPWSVGVGGSRDFGDTTVHLGLEWFSSVGLYDVLPAQSVVPITGGEGIDPSIRSESDAVVNVAAGASHRFDEKWTGYASLRTDFSAAVQDSPSNLSFTNWNLYHLAAGATVTTPSVEFTTGAVFAFGSSSAPPRLNERDLKSTYFRVSLILGFSFGFADTPSTQ
jgi:hypothetical protein